MEAEEVCFVSGFVRCYFDEYIVRLNSEKFGVREVPPRGGLDIQKPLSVKHCIG